MTILLSLIAFYMLILLTGKSVERINYLGYLFVGIITAIEVGVVLYLLFVMETPNM
jgi:heme/copper-type cytochrome/quinol oxidase subunit 4